MIVTAEQLEAAAAYARNREADLTLAQADGSTELRVAADTVIQRDGAVFREALHEGRFLREPVLR